MLTSPPETSPSPWGVETTLLDGTGAGADTGAGAIESDPTVDLHLVQSIHLCMKRSLPIDALVV